ncbi:hypothetical protein LOK49_LG15G00301 [Camellia lanceoleosa]|uniref:Uncharacterized protein n=1 Tax=Camellia lanceoleosa TaxID=1840588 RepID=A0ACC0F4S5_9ERIC|nr:hypothetical protein LOK49_LG15G00301 [Camellia lanceoleosa]
MDSTCWYMSSTKMVLFMTSSISQMNLASH